MENSVPLEKVLRLAKQLSPRDKLRLIERIAPQIEGELKPSARLPRRSLLGLWRGLDLTDQDIDDVRREMWADFPREDI